MTGTPDLLRAVRDTEAEIGAQSLPQLVAVENAARDVMRDQPFRNCASDCRLTSTGQAGQPESGCASRGRTCRTHFEEQAAAQQPAGSRRGTPFYTARLEGPVRLVEDPSTGLLLATARFQAVANFTTPDGTPLDPVPVGGAADWFAFYDPGANFPLGAVAASGSWHAVGAGSP